MVARLWNGHRPPLPSRLFFFPPVAPQPTGPTRTAFANLPQGRFSSFYCSPSSCRSVFSLDPSAARLFVNNLQAQAQPSPTHHPVVASCCRVVDVHRKPEPDIPRAAPLSSVTDTADSSTRSQFSAARFGLRQRTRDPCPTFGRLCSQNTIALEQAPAP